MRKYVIIGTGAAGYAAAKAIRERDKEASIVMIGKEPYPPYHRPRLSHSIGVVVAIEKLLIEKRESLEEAGIRLELGQTVSAIERSMQELVMEDGSRIKYDCLLLATGANPFIPPFEGVWTKEMAALRSFDDLIRLNESLKSQEEIAVIGGGLLGLEAAWALKKAGNQVRVIEFFNSLLPRQLDPELGRVFQEMLEAKGLQFFLSESLVSAEESQAGLELKLKGGESFTVNHLVFSVGVRADARLASEAGLETNRGILVDHHLKTSDPAIYAAGDAVELDGQGFGLWSQATEQGRVAGFNMTGDHVHYAPSAPFTLLSISGIRLFSIGEIQDYDKTMDAFYEDKQRWKRLYIKGERVVGGVLIGDVSQMQRLKRLVKGQTFVDATWNVEELLV